MRNHSEKPSMLACTIAGRKNYMRACTIAAHRSSVTAWVGGLEQQPQCASGPPVRPLNQVPHSGDSIRFWPDAKLALLTVKWHLPS